MKILISMAVVLFCMNANATELNLNEYKGKVVYLDFWASWCGPCKESFPWLNKLAKENKDLVVIGVNLDKDKSDAEAFLKKYPADFKVVYNPKADLAEKYKVKGMPYTIIFDKEGNQKFKHIGFSLKKADEYMREIKTLQNEVKK